PPRVGDLGIHSDQPGDRYRCFSEVGEPLAELFDPGQQLLEGVPPLGVPSVHATLVRLDVDAEEDRDLLAALPVEEPADGLDRQQADDRIDHSLEPRVHDGRPYKLCAGFITVWRVRSVRSRVARGTGPTST